MACGILVPRPGFELKPPLLWKHGALTPGLPGVRAPCFQSRGGLSSGLPGTSLLVLLESGVGRTCSRSSQRINAFL